MIVRTLGSNRKPKTLNQRDWDRIVQDRRSGMRRPASVKEPSTVRDQQIRHNLKFLLAVLNWAMKVFDTSGRRLLEFNPLRVLLFPKESHRTQRRPDPGSGTHGRVEERTDRRTGLPTSRPRDDATSISRAAFGRHSGEAIQPTPPHFLPGKSKSRPHAKCKRDTNLLTDREGFEPSIRFHVYTLSRRAPSTARPPVLIFDYSLDKLLTCWDLF
jgi:hypothetical protein